MNRLVWLPAVLLLVAASGCGGSGKEQKPAAAQGAKAPAPAAADEAGMCKEHGVLEALCTKCNPKLVPIFQAKGDWCAEHGFPKSVCPTCFPERKGRPAVDVTADEAPADGTKVILKSREAARFAGIEVVKAALGRGASGITAPAVIAFDPSRVAQVTARAPGVVKRVSAEIGAHVAAGATLAVIESAAVSSDQSRLAAAWSRVEVAETGFRRESELEKKGISSRREVLAAEQDLRQAKAEHEVLQASLRGVGAQSGAAGRYVVKAPLSGVVTARTVSVEGYVDSGSPLFEIADTATVSAEVAVAEADLPSVRPGTGVVITFDVLGEREFRGSIASIAPALDPVTRTAKARVRLANPGGILRANMYGRARILVKNAQPGVAVPAGAVQQVGQVKLVFVRRGVDEFEVRRVEASPNRGSGGLVELASGVEAGEEVVVAGSFFLKTETLKDAIGAGCCEVEKK